VVVELRVVAGGGQVFAGRVSPRKTRGMNLTLWRSSIPRF